MPSPADPRPPPAEEARRHPVWRFVRFAGLIAGSGFLLWVIGGLLRNPAVAFRGVVPAGFVVALIVGVIANAATGVIFGDLIAKLAPDIPSRRRIASYYFSQLAKYIPGRVAALLVQSATLNRRGAMTVTIVSSIELMALSAWACTAAAFVCIAAQRGALPALACAVAGVLVGAWLMRLDWRPLIRFARGVLRQPNDTDANVVVADTRPSVPRALLLSAALLLLPAASIYLLLAQGFSLGFERALVLTSALLLSWVGGMLAFVFPAGIGIRELLFIGLGHSLAYAATPDQMAAIAVMSRLVQVLTDVVGVALFSLFELMSRGSASHESR